MPRIRILQSIAGVDGSWAPGEEIDVDGPTASAWADGERAELVIEQAATEKATPRSRGGGRGSRAETRST